MVGILVSAELATLGLLKTDTFNNRYDVIISSHTPLTKVYHMTQIIL